jgi:MerC mercury resistance protein
MPSAVGHSRPGWIATPWLSVSSWKQLIGRFSVFDENPLSHLRAGDYRRPQAMNTTAHLRRSDLLLVDRLGMAMSLACGIHCALLPILISALSIGWLRPFADESAEWWFVSASAILGVIAHAAGYVRHHRRAGPTLLFTMGLALVLSGRLWLAETLVEPWALGLGGTCLAGAHWINVRLCRSCATCQA